MEVCSCDSTVKLSDEEKLNVVLDQWVGMMMMASSRYSIPGKFDIDDGFQEALICAWDLIKKGYDVSSKDFTKMFKTTMWHRLMDCVDHHKTGSRNYKRTKSFPEDPVQLGSYEPSPLDNMITDETVNLMKDSLSDDGKRLLDEILYPSNHLQECMLEYQQSRKCPARRRVPLVVFAHALGITHKRVRIAMYGIKQAYHNTCR